MEANGGSLSCFRNQMAMAHEEEFDDPRLFHLIEESMWAKTCRIPDRHPNLLDKRRASKGAYDGISGHA